MRAIRRLSILLGCALAVGACEGSNLFEPCDPDGDTPHTPCEQAALFPSPDNARDQPAQVGFNV